MLTHYAAKQRIKELAAEVKAKNADFEAGKIKDVGYYKKFLDRAESEFDELQAVVATHKKAISMSAYGDSDQFQAPGIPTTKAGGGVAMSTAKWQPDSPLHASADQWKSLYAATRSRVGGYAVNISSKGDPSGWEIGMKAALGEGAPGSLLPPQLLPQAFGLRYEPDRAFDHFIGARAETQSVSWLQHTGNTAPAGPVAELALKPDVGMQIAPKTVSFTTIAALASFSRQLADDFDSWMGFVPQELTNAVINAETDQICNGDGTGANMLGLLHTSGVLTRPKGTDTNIDALIKSFNDIRVGSSFGIANLALMSPGTFTLLKTAKDTQGRYLLALNQPNDIGSIDNIFGVKVITNSKVPDGTAIVMDTTIAVLAWTRLGLEVALNQFGAFEFNQNALTYRVEERVAIGVQRPSAICVVTGLS